MNCLDGLTMVFQIVFTFFTLLTISDQQLNRGTPAISALKLVKAGWMRYSDQAVTVGAVSEDFPWNDSDLNASNFLHW